MSKSNALLNELDDAFETAEQKAASLASARSEASTAIAEKQAALDAVKKQHDAYVLEAETAYRDAQVALERLREQLNERIGTITAVNPRVVVR